MSAQAPSSCTLCGKEGIYMFEGKLYCPSCMSKKRPPLSHPGPERRRHENPTMWRRRQADSKGKKPSKG
jgi:hypothetical protein